MSFTADSHGPNYRPVDRNDYRDDVKATTDRIRSHNNQVNTLARKLFPDMPKGDVLLPNTQIVWKKEHISLLMALDKLSVPTYSMRCEKDGKFDLKTALDPFKNPDIKELHDIIEPLIEAGKIRLATSSKVRNIHLSDLPDK